MPHTPHRYAGGKEVDAYVGVGQLSLKGRLGFCNSTAPTVYGERGGVGRFHARFIILGTCENMDALAPGGSCFSASALWAIALSSFKDIHCLLVSIIARRITPFNSLFIPLITNPNSAFSHSLQVLCSSSASFIYSFTLCVCLSEHHLSIHCSAASCGWNWSRNASKNNSNVHKCPYPLFAFKSVHHAFALPVRNHVAVCTCDGPGGTSYIGIMERTESHHAAKSVGCGSPA